MCGSKISVGTERFFGMSKSYNDSPIQLNNANERSARTLPKNKLRLKKLLSGRGRTAGSDVGKREVVRDVLPIFAVHFDVGIDEVVERIAGLRGIQH